MIKNPTPQQISLFASIFVSGIVLLVLTIFSTLNLLSIPKLSLAVTFSLTFITTYLVTIYYLKKYIYRKIKLIYKSIHKHKLSASEKKEVVDIHSDIIDEVEREVSLWADNQAKEIEQLKLWQDYRRRFLGDISHELKTPIFNIQGYLETLIDGGLEDHRINRSYIERANKNVSRLITIVEDLQAISSLEDGAQMLEMQTFDIRELTHEVFDEMHIKAMEKNIELTYKQGADLGYKVTADRENIRQVLTNLINNSIKYGINDGETKVGFYDMDKNILIEVADNGIGIPITHITKVFERFYRVDKSRSRTQGGTGLGLSIVKHIIEAHKQTVNVRSSENYGSTFGFTLEKA